MRCFSPCTISITYLKRLPDDSQNDIDLDFFCQALVGAEIEQLKLTSGRNAVTVDWSGQSIGQEEDDEDSNAIRHDFTLSEGSIGQMVAAGP